MSTYLFIYGSSTKESVFSIMLEESHVIRLLIHLTSKGISRVLGHFPENNFSMILWKLVIFQIHCFQMTPKASPKMSWTSKFFLDLNFRSYTTTELLQVQHYLCQTEIAQNVYTIYLFFSQMETKRKFQSIDHMRESNDLETQMMNLLDEAGN